MTRTAPDVLRVPPAVYFPFESGRYDVKPGLLQLGRHTLHGRLESHVFAFDRDYARYVAAKVQARARGLHLHYLQAALPATLRSAVLEFALARAASESMGSITWDGVTLTNHVMGWRGSVDVARGTLEDLQCFSAPHADVVAGVAPLDALDFLGLNVMEDYAIVARHPATGEDWQACLHVSLPEHWDPRDKIGRSFGPVHAPVAGAAPMIATAAKLMAAVMEKGPFYRFAWGVTTSATLNHHPQAGESAARGAGNFDPAGTFVRVERQVLWGFPRENGALFTIRPYVYPLLGVVSDPARGQQLSAALRTMSDEQLAYKGLLALRDPLVAYLDAVSG